MIGGWIKGVHLRAGKRSPRDEIPHAPTASRRTQAQFQDTPADENWIDHIGVRPVEPSTLQPS